MARIRTVDFLPEIFKTDVNREFLGATLDQLVQEPEMKRTQGYIGRRFGPGTRYSDNYVLEETAIRANYQLEPGIVFTDDTGNATDAITYPGIIDALSTSSGNVNRHDRLFASKTYSWDPDIDPDKFINYGQYYWLPNGPDAVDVQSTDIAETDNFDVSESETGAFNLSGIAGNNPTITLVRGGSYTFEVDQDSPFWIQAEAGVDGTFNYSPNIGTRDVLGVVNNGATSGTVTFNVPTQNAQQFYHDLTDLGTVDLATTQRFDSINRKFLSEFDSIDGITDLEGKTLVFLQDQPGDSYDLGWQREGQFDSGKFGDEFEPTVYLDTPAERYAIFTIQVVRPYGNDTGAYYELIATTNVEEQSKFTVTYGTEYSNRTFYKDESGYFTEQPLLTAANDYLFYQDGTIANRFGVIKFVNSTGAQELDINEEIIGKANYISPNGVTFSNGMKIVFRGNVEPAEYQDQEYYVAGVGTEINLTPVEELTTPEDFYNNVNGTNNQPQNLDYITIKRESTNRNPWSRSNRWFHADIIAKTAEYNQSVATFDNDYRAKRPIIEFNANLKLFNYGTQAIAPIDVIDFKESDALSNIHGSGGRSVDGYALSNGTRIVFANDTDPAVRNKIYTVSIVDPDGIATNSGDIIALRPADDANVLVNNVVLCESGNTLLGKQFFYDGESWTQCQAKTAQNQAPVFDVFDANGYSFGDSTKYPSTNFTGSKLFSYKVGSTVAVDPVLGFSLSYENIDNIGDIVFESNRITDEFLYVAESTSETVSVATGFTRKYTDRANYTSGSGWTTSADRNWQRQVFVFQYDGKTSLATDVAPRTDLNIPAVKVYVENKFVNPSTYTVLNTGEQAIITFNNTSLAKEGDLVEVKIISQQASSIAYYEVPSNLASNTFNQENGTYTLGTIRNHYNRLTENVNGFDGSVNGSNNLRDVGNATQYGDVIVQHSAPLAPAAFFLRNQDYDFFNALELSARDYQNYKNQILHWVDQNDIYGLTAAEILDRAVADITVGKTTDSAYYWEDMLPVGGDYTDIVNQISVISDRSFRTSNTYNFTASNSQGLVVYYNDTQLVRGVDYTVATDGPRIELTFDPMVGDTLTIREYPTTYGSFVPPTPTKLGLHPSKVPEIYTDYTYVVPTKVVQGHDGSITVAFDDMRDDVLLEFERRVYNNIKLDNNPLPIELADVCPGGFRSTEYTEAEVNEILAESFLDWTGWNKINYKTQSYQSGNQWTWNYSTAVCKLDNSLLPGHWRGAYLKYFDTDRPNLHPWEMLGLSSKPWWWENTYGLAPYTSGNLVLWEDLEAGLIKEPNNNRVDSRYARPGLTRIIPVDSEGNLINPMESLVGNYNQVDLRKSWNFGDGGPAESAWRRSSDYAFAVQKLFALTKPAEYFALMVDRDRNRYSAILGSYVYDGRLRYDFRNTEVANNDTVKHSYMNWIINQRRTIGILSSEKLSTAISNTDVRLCYRVGGFTGANYLKLFTDKSSPDSSNTNLTIPDESYSLLVYKNQAFTDIQYSSVMVQKTANGYAVYGNSQSEAFFRILKSENNGNYITSRQGTNTYRLPLDFTDTVIRVPYGYSFTTANGVVDFLLSYGKYLESQGLVFSTIENNTELSWGQMCNEFLYWANQDWAEGSLININPSANLIEFNRLRAVVEDLRNLAANNQPLDQNRTPMETRDYAVTRLGTQFKMQALSSKSLSYLRLRLVSYEHLLILDNRTIFNDLMYDPSVGLRQMRVRVDGYRTENWDGQLNARGFVLNQDNVAEWDPNLAYRRGDLVKYKNAYWTATNQLQPTSTFVFEDWSKIDYSAISKGLLPNIANKADQMTKYYNNRVANLESDADLLSLGLTGFRKRDYLEALALDDISQVAVYQNLVENKGTPATAKLFRNVEIDKETADYDIFENWAVKRADYGASDNKRFVELALDNSLLLSNPSVVEIIDKTNQTDINDEHLHTGNQRILVSDIYKQSVKNTSKNIFPALNETITDTNMPTAGYVNLDDVDISIFDWNELDKIAENIDRVQTGTHVWVARKNTYDWDVYRCTPVEPNEVTVVDNLNSTLSFTFESGHSLLPGQVIVVKQLDDLVNGVYRVKRVSDYRTIIVDGTLGEDIASVEGNAVVFKLESARVAQPSDIATVSGIDKFTAGDRFWVDDNINNRWSVYTKSDAFKFVDSQVPPGTSSTTGFGTTLAQSNANTSLLVGAPTQNGLYCYNKTSSNYQYTITAKAVNQAAELGASVDFASSWAVAGAPGTTGAYTTDFGAAVVIKHTPSENSYQEYQVLTAPGGDHSAFGKRFGHKVLISDDENWIYVSSVVYSDVYAFQRIAYQNQQFTVTADGNTASYSLANKIIVDTKEQLIVTVGNKELETSEYILLTTNVVSINELPEAGTNVTIQRRTQAEALGDGSTTTFAHPLSLYTAQSIESLQVYVNGKLMRPTYDYTFAAGTVTFTTAPAGNAGITFRASDYFKYEFTISESSNAGESIATTTDGQQIYIGKPEYTDGTLTDSGAVEVYERVVERFVVTDTTKRTYRVRGQLDPQSAVRVNDNRLLNSDVNVGLGQTYTIDTLQQTVTFDDNVEFVVGDNIDIDIDERNHVQTLTLGNANQSASFGSTVDVCPTECSVYVGAPGDNWTLPGAGSVSRFVNSSRLFGTITGAQTNPTLTPTDTIRINNIVVEITGTSVEEAADDINRAVLPNVQATAADGKLVISVVNTKEAKIRSKLMVMPGTGTAFADLGLQPFENVQTIRSPHEVEYAQFGSSLHIDTTSTTLVVGASHGHSRLYATLDNNSTALDSDTTHIIDSVNNSGAVYTFDWLPSNLETTPGQFVFGQHIYDNNINETDVFGAAVDYTNGTLVVASTGYDTNVKDIGRIAIFNNNEQANCWQVSSEETTTADVRKANYCYIYDRSTQDVLAYLDYIDPVNGKHLGAVEQNLDYVSALDPAVYNAGGKRAGAAWTNNHLGELWWDTTKIAYVNYNQEDTVYAAKNWGALAEGSQVDVYEWIESDLLPTQYIGTVKDVNEYSEVVGINAERTIVTKYYFWAKTSQVNRNIGKTLSAQTVAEYISKPQASGIPYAALITPSTVALYNATDYIRDNSQSVLHIEYNQTLIDSKVFTEYELIRSGAATDWLPDQLWRKMKDSLCGSDDAGNLVPDFTLAPTDKYGISFRPRQSMFVNRFAALDDIMTQVNSTLLTAPFAELRTFTILVSEEPVPSTNANQWDSRITDLTELSYQNTSADGVGYRYLVETDSDNEGFWTIYTVDSNFNLVLSRVQSYNTLRYWEYTDWFADGYNSLTKPGQIVRTYSELLTLSVATDTVVKVTTNSDNKWELYAFKANKWTRVGLEDGTIQLSPALWTYSLENTGFDAEVFDAQFYDREPTTELRYILDAIANELLVGDFLAYRNKLLIAAFNYILFEQGKVDWLYKTSLVDVSHKVRDLVQYPIYRKDNQDFVLDYINESKPYHVQIKEFLTRYEGLDTVTGNVNDYDVPAAYDPTYSQFISPILDDGIAILETSNSNRKEYDDDTVVQAASDVWSTKPWSDWYANHKLSIDRVVVTNGGTGYTVPPVVTFTGEADTQATGTAIIDETGEVTAITVTNPGEGYRTTPLVVLSGGNGTGATAATYTKHDLVRSIATTLRYDRCEYDYDPEEWIEPVYKKDEETGETILVKPSPAYPPGYRVMYNGTQYVCRNINSSGHLVPSTPNVFLENEWLYVNVVIDWKADTVYQTNQLLRHNNLVYRATQADGSTPSDTTFDPLIHEIVSADTLSGIDRTSGFYVADVNNPGLDLALLINGLDYPMIQLKGPSFLADSGFGADRYDVNVFDGTTYDASGSITYSDSILDNQILSSFDGIYTGVDLSGIDSVQATATATIAGLEVTAIDVNEAGKGYLADVPPFVTVSSPVDNLTATALATIDGDEVTSIDVTNPGFGYINTPVVTIIEQSPTPGVAALGTTEVTSGEVTNVIVDVAGSGYTVAPAVTFADPPSLSIARAEATADTLSSTGSVTATTVTNPGNSYTSSPNVTVSSPPASVTATGTIAMSTTLSTEATGTVTESGNYYSTNPVVTVSAPDLAPAQATASAITDGNEITSITVDATGYMYKNAPTVTITPAPPTTGTQAVGVATLDPTLTGFDSADGFDATALDTEGGIGSISVLVVDGGNPGTGYTVAPTVTISAPDITGGTQATATATISGDTAPLYTGQGTVTSITVTESGSGYTSAPIVTISAPDSQINHGTGASATATILNTSVINIDVDTGGSYYDLTPTVTISAPDPAETAVIEATATNGVITALTATNTGWGYNVAPTLTIATPDTAPVTAQFTAVLTSDEVTGLTIDNPGAGYLEPPTLLIDVDPNLVDQIATGTAVLLNDGVASVTITNPGEHYTSPPAVTIDLPDGLTYHGSGATAEATIDSEGVASIAITNPGTGYDLEPTVTIGAPTRTTRQAKASAVIEDGQVVGYTITDPGYGYLRTPTVQVGAPSDIDPDSDVVGNKFIDVYNSHAPEELVPGAIFDTLDFRVFTRPGYDYLGDGHGWELKSFVQTSNGLGSKVSWAGLVDYPTTIMVFNATAGLRLYESIHYSVDWVEKTVTVTSGAANGQDIKVYAYGIGGGNQLLHTALNGADFGTTAQLNVAYTDIDSIYVQVNGVEITTFTYEQGEFASVTDITFDTDYSATDYISISVFGQPAVAGQSLSKPVTEVFVADGSTETFTISANTADISREAIIVEHNGYRLRPPAGKQHLGDGSTLTFALLNGDRAGIDLTQIVQSDVVVYVDNVRTTAGTDWTLDAAVDSANCTVTFTSAPANNANVDLYITKTDGNVVATIEQGKLARYTIVDDQLTIITGNGLTLLPGDTIAVTSFNDAREQNPVTQVYTGPRTISVPTRELFDQYGFDSDLWDRTSGVDVQINEFELFMEIKNTDRVWLTVNGRRLNPGLEYSVVGSTMYIAGTAISETDVVAITTFTDSVVPDALGFRIFKDMRNNTGVYSIHNRSGVTELTQDLLWTDDTIHVLDASKLGQPNLDVAIFGIVTINGERITYRERDLDNNTISGLRRGTAGTGMHQVHESSSVVLDIGAGEALSTPYNETWYNQGATTASDGVALQQTDSVAANFLKGL